MRSAYLDGFSREEPGKARRRAIGIFLSVLAELLLVLVLLTLGPKEFGGPDRGNRLKTFTVTERAGDQPTEATKQRQKRDRQASKSANRPDATTPPPIKPPMPVPAKDWTIPGLIVLSKQDYAAADIGKIKSEAANAGDASGGDAGDSDALAGGSFRGEPLYRAEWYREPTDAELAFYVPKGFREGAALIACQTAPRYKVENCQILGDDPPGTGLARGMRDAAWQFLVRPPRKGGKALIGVWVRIEITFTAKEAK